MRTQVCAQKPYCNPEDNSPVFIHLAQIHDKTQIEEEKIDNQRRKESSDIIMNSRKPQSLAKVAFYFTFYSLFIYAFYIYKSSNRGQKSYYALKISSL